MLKICMLVGTDMSHDARVWKEAKSLAADGHAVTVLAAFNPALPEREECHAVKVIRVAPRPRRRIRRSQSDQTPGCHTKANDGNGQDRDPRFSRIRAFVWTIRVMAQIVREICTIRPDVIHIHDADRLFVGGLAHMLVRKPYLYDSHEYVVGMFSERNLLTWLRTSWYGFLERALLPRAQAVITTNDTTRDRLGKRYFVRRFAVVHNYPEPVPPDRNGACLRASIPKKYRNHPLLLYQGRLTAYRGIEVFVDVVRKVPEAAAVIIGSGPIESQLKRRAAELRLEERLTFLPQVPWDELLRYTAGADIGFCLTQDTCENNRIAEPNKLFEYLMVGVPVVASDFPGIRECVVDADVGVVVPPADADEIARCVSELIASPYRLSEMRAKAFAVAQTRYHWDATAKALLELYRNMEERVGRTLSSPPPGSCVCHVG